MGLALTVCVVTHVGLHILAPLAALLPAHHCAPPIHPPHPTPAGAPRTAPEGVCHTLELPLVAHQGAGIEGPQVQRIIVQGGLWE